MVSAVPRVRYQCNNAEVPAPILSEGKSDHRFPAGHASVADDACSVPDVFKPQNKKSAGSSVGETQGPLAIAP